MRKIWNIYLHVTGFSILGSDATLKKNKKNETTRTSPWQHIVIEEAHTGERTDIRS
jgi:hypothetical protein